MRRKRGSALRWPAGGGDTPAGDVDYARYGAGYAGQRRTDPRIAALVHQALGRAETVLNVGAGAGSYEPEGCRVVAVEPSEAMVAQRPAGLGPAVRAVAGALPLADRRVDASMAMVTVHQWPDPLEGLAEMRRVTSGPVVVLTFDPDALTRPVAGRVRTRPVGRGGIPVSLDRLHRHRPRARGGGPTGAGALRLRRRVHRGLLRPSGGIPRS